MKKFSKFGIAAVLASSIISSVAADGLFVGIGGDYNIRSQYDAQFLDRAYNMTPFAMSDYFEHKDHQYSVGFRLGWDFDWFKLYGGYNFEPKAHNSKIIYVLYYNPVEQNFEYKSREFLVGVDLTPKIIADLRALIGFYGGIAKINVKVHDIEVPGYHETIADYKQSGTIFGAKIGVIYELGKLGEIELGFKSDRSDYKDKDIDGGGLYYGYPNSDKIAVVNGNKMSNAVFVGYNYKF